MALKLLQGLVLTAVLAITLAIKEEEQKVDK